MVWCHTVLQGDFLSACITANGPAIKESSAVRNKSCYPTPIPTEGPMSALWQKALFGRKRRVCSPQLTLNPEWFSKPSENSHLQFLIFYG